MTYKRFAFLNLILERTLTFNITYIYSFFSRNPRSHFPVLDWLDFKIYEEKNYNNDRFLPFSLSFETNHPIKRHLTVNQSKMDSFYMATKKYK